MPKILVIDDEEPLRGMLAAALRRHGFDVLHAANGSEGIRIACDELPDLVVTDVQMPGTGGFEVLETLRQDPSAWSVPVILLTGQPDSEEKQRAEQLSAAAYLAKPISAADLIRAAPPTDDAASQTVKLGYAEARKKNPD